MHIILVSNQRLAAKYSEKGLRRLQRRIDELVQARLKRQVLTQVLVVEQGLADRGVAPADPGDAEAISIQLATLADSLDQQGGRLESVLLIGGPNVLPFHLCKNPLFDTDGLIPADYPYGGRDSSQLLAEWPVGRLPDSADDNPGDLLRLLLLATRYQRSMPRPPGKAFGYSTAAWEHASNDVYSALADPQALLISPPRDVNNLDRSLLDGAWRVYCNLHGVKDGPFWYGQATDRWGQLVVALRPQDIEGLHFNGAVVISEACYGAYSPDYDLGESLALRFLMQGAACFVGATTVAYGPTKPPLSEADLLAHSFLQASVQPGISAGEAFQAAQQDTLRETLRLQGFLDDDDTKTLMQFVLYGDPTIIIGSA